MARRGGSRKSGYDPGNMVELQLQAWRLGLSWLELTAGAAAVIGWRSALIWQAMLQPARLADPEFSLMVTEKVAALGEAVERASRHALRHQGRGSAVPHDLAAAMSLAQSCLVPFSRRVRGNARRLGRPRN